MIIKNPLHSSPLLLAFLLFIVLSIASCKKPGSNDEITFEDGNGLTDLDGNYYPSIILGNGQEWMAINLKTTKYANGDLITNAISDVVWSNASSGAWCNYENDPQNDEIYGKLYNWHALIGDTLHLMRIIDNTNTNSKDTIFYDSIPCKICPDGWRMPYEDDWIDLINYLGNANVAGGKMKDTSLQYWKSPNLSATNESGFSGLPGGQRNSNGSFEYLTEIGRWWCFEDVYEDYAHTRPLLYDQETTLNHYVYQKEGGLSVRLIKK